MNHTSTLHIAPSKYISKQCMRNRNLVGLCKNQNYSPCEWLNEST